MSRLAPLLASALALSAPRAFAAEARLVVSFDDPAGDATGPGTYLPPIDPMFADGDFDLRRFAVYDEGEVVRLEVTLGAAIRAPEARRQGTELPPDLTNGIYLQNVDIYVDTDPGPGSGFYRCIPGRRVAFAEDKTWEAAVVLTPQPRAARAAVAEVLGDAAGHVLFPGPLEVRDRTIVARIPAAALGGPPRKDWGWSVQISGARWVRTTDSREPEAFTLPVLGAPGPRAFGGAPPGDAHPRVVDVLLPSGVDQKAVLGSFDATTGAFARVPFVHAEPAVASPPQASTAPPPSLTPRLSPFLAPPRPGDASSPSRAAAAQQASPAPGSPPSTSAGPLLTVAEISENVVTLAGPNIGLAPKQVGSVLGRDGATVGHVVIDKVLENGAVTHVVSGRENVRWGARVRFDGQTAKR